MERTQRKLGFDERYKTPILAQRPLLVKTGGRGDGSDAALLVPGRGLELTQAAVGCFLSVVIWQSTDPTVIYDLLGIPGNCGERVIAAERLSSSQLTGHRCPVTGCEKNASQLEVCVLLDKTALLCFSHQNDTTRRILSFDDDDLR
ncbi:hypothetical protein F2P81_007317 [Scophthalmus maximus]|uniref:Uncharacterized protein n=1 Tax=Scophthalmus maximus TaxID=52904 RepID=A0A6A4T987_SCOMX|nr:hypothetical protein F2P81_007317 [Scophthalmus maximus]